MLSEEYSSNGGVRVSVARKVRVMCGIFFLNHIGEIKNKCKYLL